MSDELPKNDRITFAASEKPSKQFSNNQESVGFRRATSHGRGDGNAGGPSRTRAGSIFQFRRMSMRERTDTLESGGYDEGFDAPRESDFRKKQVFHGWRLLFLAYQSTGVIYGDIGTSPLYVYSSTFSEPPAKEDLIGALSIIIYSLTMIVTIKYVCIVLNADNEGQGGTFAMYSLLTRFGNIATGTDPNKENMIRFQRHNTQALDPGNRRARDFFERNIWSRVFLSGMAMFGVSLIMSDGILTPAQSVLGAIQGLNVVRPDLGNGAIVGITCAILVLLYAVQPLGVERISIVFAPIVIIWLLLNLVFGIYNLAKFDHSVLKAFSPYFVGEYFVRNKTEGWKSLGGILLCFTGCEALFADLGAFSKRSIQISWLGLVYPCLLMAYIGQAAVISVRPEAYANPFFEAAPPGTFWPALIISILAAIVASQALITSTFQLLFQVINMSYFPPIKIVNTSVKYHSQIFIPIANWLMMIGTIVVTAVFRNTTKLGNAYGVCVIFDTVITTTFVSLVALFVWRIRWYFVFPFWLTFATLEGLYLTSALNKVPDGAWFTISLAVAIATVFSTWRFGKERQWISERGGRLPKLSKLVRRDKRGYTVLTEDFGSGEITPLKGMGIFFDKAGGNFVPVIYQEFLQKFEAQPLVQVFLHLRSSTVPFVSDEEKYAITRTGLPNCYRLVIRYGYAEYAVSEDFGRKVYEQIKQYIHTELEPDGRSSAINVQPRDILPDGEDPSRQNSDQSSVNQRFSTTAGFDPVLDTLHNTPDIAPDEKFSEKDSEKQSSPDPRHEAHLLPPPRFGTEKEKMLKTLDDAYRQQVLYIVGKEDLQVPSEKRYNIVKRFFLGAFLFLRDSTNEKSTTWKIPRDKLVEVGFIRNL